MEEAKDQSGINTDLPVDLVPFDKLVKQIGRKVGMAGAWDVLAPLSARRYAIPKALSNAGTINVLAGMASGISYSQNL